MQSRCASLRRDGSSCTSVALAGGRCLYHGKVETALAAEKFHASIEAGDSQLASVRLPRLSAPLAELPDHQKQGLLLFLIEAYPRLGLLPNPHGPLDKHRSNAGQPMFTLLGRS